MTHENNYNELFILSIEYNFFFIQIQVNIQSK